MKGTSKEISARVEVTYNEVIHTVSYSITFTIICERLQHAKYVENYFMCNFNHMMNSLLSKDNTTNYGETKVKDFF